jgi:signal recognition particle receptor subunit beta
MVQFNFSERTIKAKVVYYGPPQSGKTTNLEQIHRISDPEGSNRLISLNTAQDRTLFFDLLPFSLGSVSGYDFKIQLYTVPGQVQYNATRRVVLAGADAVVFVADSQKSMARENLAAFENMKVNLLANRLVPEKVPLVLQYNKQDLEPLTPRPELDQTLNFWGRKAFPAIAARGEGVMETFVAVVQDMLAAIALKYNLKEKGLDPQAVPQVVAQAFAALLRPPAAARAVSAAAASPTSAPAPAPPPPPRVVIAQPEGMEPAYPGQVGTEASPVSEELLHRAIRSNVELAEALGELIRDVGQGLEAILAQTQHLAAAGEESSRGSRVAAIQREVQRLRPQWRDVGLAAGAGRAAGPGRAPAPPQAPPTPPRGTSPAAPPARPAPATPAPPPRAAPAAPPARPAPATPAPPPRAAPPAPPARPAPTASPVPRPVAAPPVAAAASLDGLVAEVVTAVRAALAARRVTVESRIAAGAPLPRCSPAGLRRALGGLLQGLAGTVTPSSAVVMRAEKKPVLLRGRDGSEARRDFLMVALTHAAGLDEAEQQRILKGADPGPLGQAQRLVREMGGFMRFAPLPGGSVETRVFLPAPPA